jgi:hypothetical protein
MNRENHFKWICAGVFLTICMLGIAQTTPWEPMSSGVDGMVTAMHANGNNLYVGGYFNQAGGHTADGLAIWDGSHWSPLNPLENFGIRAILYNESTLYVGGRMTVDGCTHIAWYDGVNWHGLGTGFDEAVNALTVFQNSLIAAGQFTYADGLVASHIAQWNGAAWTGLGSGLSDVAWAMASTGQYIYVGGIFKKAGGTPANYIARWDGTSWSSLGDGLNDWVSVIVCAGNDVYVGGHFTEAGGHPANHIAKWDGTGWSSLGMGVEGGGVGAIVVHGNDVYVGGDFTHAGGTVAKYAAKWDGISWTSLEGNFTGSGVTTLSIIGEKLYAGGSFSEAGGQLCSNIAAFHISPVYENLQPVSYSNIPNINEKSMGSSWSDYDKDGDPDLFVANDGSQNNRLYRNNGNGSFTNMTTGAVISDGGHSMGGCWADYDNDGDDDLFVPNTSGDNNFLYTNVNGFLERDYSPVIANEGGNSTSGCWGDYDNDGWLDLFVTNLGANNFLYHNNGDGSFSKVISGPLVTDGGQSTGGSWCDYDLDGDLDLFVSNTDWSDNFLYRNEGGGTFTRVTSGPVVSNPAESFGGSWGDYNNDGFPDLYVPNSGQDNQLFRNNGNGEFTKITEGFLVNDDIRSRSSFWGDLNQDGYLDLVVVNRNANSNIFLGCDDETFDSYIVRTVDGRGGSLCDYDRDGDLDLFLCNYGMEDVLLQNYSGSGHWLKIQCLGTVSNRNGIGAKVKIFDGTKWQSREITSQTGFGSQNEMIAHFGLNQSDMVSQLCIEWPSGIVWDTTGVTADQRLMIIEKHPEVPPINEAPVAVNDIRSVLQNTEIQIFVLGNDTDPDDDPLMIVAIDTTAISGSAWIDPGDTTLTYTPYSDFAGKDSLDYVISDGRGGLDTATVNITVIQENHPPVAVNDTRSVLQNMQIKMFVLANDFDPDEDNLTIISVQTANSTGSAWIDTGDSTLTYMPAAEFVGQDTLAYVVSDGSDGVDTASVFITVLAVNQFPVAVNDTLSVLQGSVTQIPVIENDRDPEGNQLSIASIDTAGIAGVVQLVDGDTALTYTAVQHFSGEERFSYIVSDGIGGLDTALVLITVMEVNHPPAAISDSITILQDSLVVLHVLQNDYDPDGDPLTVIEIGDVGTTGSLFVQSGDTVLIFVPRTGFTGTLTFNYMISDGRGGFDTTFVFVQVGPTTGVSEGTPQPAVFALYQNHPNPFNPVTQIQYDLPKANRVCMTVCDVMGRELADLVNRDQSAGRYQVNWDGCDKLGHPVPSGVYFYRLQAGEFKAVKKMLLVR